MKNVTFRFEQRPVLVLVAAIMTAALVVACNPDQTVAATLDVRRCTEMAEDGVEAELMLDLAEQANIPFDALVGFLASPVYAENPQAWDFTFCLGYYGWECYGGTGVGTLEPTPPTECRSSGETFVVVDNPYS